MNLDELLAEVVAFLFFLSQMEYALLITPGTI